MNITSQELDPIVDTLRVKEWMGKISDKRGKIARMIHAGELLQLRRGLYATRRDLHPYSLAASIHGPAYVSFETALSFYVLIPEAVPEIVCATLRRAKEFETAFGRYRYRNVPRSAYPIGIERVTEGSLPFLMASPTKALCDRIALEPRMRSMSDVRRWVELMRFGQEPDLDPAVLSACAEHYRRPAVRLLWRTVEKYGGILS